MLPVLLGLKLTNKVRGKNETAVKKSRSFDNIAIAWKFCFSRNIELDNDRSTVETSFAFTGIFYSEFKCRYVILLMADIGFFV